jgi:hypothetical protein
VLSSVASWFSVANLAQQASANRACVGSRHVIAAGFAERSGANDYSSFNSVRASANSWRRACQLVANIWHKRNIGATNLFERVAQFVMNSKRKEEKTERKDEKLSFFVVVTQSDRCVVTAPMPHPTDTYIHIHMTHTTHNISLSHILSLGMSDDAAAKELALNEFRKALLEHTEISAKLKQRANCVSL